LWSSSSPSSFTWPSGSSRSVLIRVCYEPAVKSQKGEPIKGFSEKDAGGSGDSGGDSERRCRRRAEVQKMRKPGAEDETKGDETDQIETRLKAKEKHVW
jgi:hypothetical protein